MNCFQPTPLLQLSSTATSLTIWLFISSRSVHIMGLFASYTIIPGYTLQPTPTKSCLGCEILIHLPHSPDLAPSDFHLFLSMSNALHNKVFTNDDELNQWLMNFFISKPASFYSEGIMSLPKNGRGYLIAMVTTSIRQINMLLKKLIF